MVPAVLESSAERIVALRSLATILAVVLHLLVELRRPLHDTVV